MMDEKCCICGEPFTDEEWGDRHTFEIEDCHEHCCPVCKDYNPMEFIENERKQMSITRLDFNVKDDDGDEWVELLWYEHMLHKAISNFIEEYGDATPPRDGIAISIKLDSDTGLPVIFVDEFRNVKQPKGKKSGLS